MLTAFLNLVATDPGISVAGVLVLLGFVAGVGLAICAGVLPARTRRLAAARLAAQLRAECTEAETMVRALRAEALAKSAMYLHGLQLARRVDASRADATPAPRKGAA